MFLPIAVIDQAVYGVALILGLAVCFFGFRMFRFWLMAAGLQAGFFAGLWVGNAILKNQLLVLIFAILLGILLAGLSFAFVKIGAFIAGGSIMVLLAALVMQLIQTGMNPYVLLVAFLIGGILGILSVRPFLILATAANGAFLVIDTTVNFISGYPVSQYQAIHSQMPVGIAALLLIGLIVLTILGAMVQFKHSRKKIKKAELADAVAPTPVPASNPEPAANPNKPESLN